MFVTTTSYDVSASSVQVGEAWIALQHKTYECLSFGQSRLQGKLWEASDAGPYIIWDLV